jgi:hypothetical protein
VSFPDNPELLRTPRNFAAHVLDNDLDADQISAQLSNLLGFAKNFFLQFFDFEFGVQIRDLDRAARKAIRPVERKLRKSKSSHATLRLISLFVTLVEFLGAEEPALSVEPAIADRRRRILEEVSDLLDRIRAWAEEHGELPRLAEEAGRVAGDFTAAVEFIDVELGYEDDDG